MQWFYKGFASYISMRGNLKIGWEAALARILYRLFLLPKDSSSWDLCEQNPLLQGTFTRRASSTKRVAHPKHLSHSVQFSSNSAQITNLHTFFEIHFVSVARFSLYTLRLGSSCLTLGSCLLRVLHLVPFKVRMQIWLRFIVCKRNRLRIVCFAGSAAVLDPLLKKGRYGI